MKIFTLLCTLVCASLGLLSAKPNIIIVMADDLGIGDISPTNPDCKIQTPHLQKMAEQGITFFDAHTSSSVCTPTRYGLLTGRYNWRSLLAKSVLGGTSKHLIPAERPTIGHMLKGAGYHTSMIGKWHLGWDWAKDGKNIDFSKPVLNGPDINGFDQYYGHCGSLDMAPYVWVDTGMPTAIPTRKEGVTREEDPYGWYRKGSIAPDFEIEKVLPHLFEKTITRIEERVKEDEPFFIYLPLPAPHTPIVPVPPFKDASKINPYADFVMQMDHHMGELMAAIKKNGIDENTLVIFTSDNGCSPEANFEVLETFDHHPSGKYRGHKADIYEGGHRVPLIFRWPGTIKGARTTDSLACLTDLYTTLEDIACQKRKPLGGEDGFNLFPLLTEKGPATRKTLINHSISGMFAIREGDWKLCLCAGSGGWSSPRDNEAKKKGLPAMQLFNLKNDPAEKTNLFEKHPEKVKSLLALLEKQVANGRSTPGENVPNDREITYLPTTSLFNKKDLSNWRVNSKSDHPHWTIKNGNIFAKSGPKNIGSILWTKKEFTDFTLTLDFKNGPGKIDSGVMLKRNHDQIQIGMSGSKKRDLTAAPYIPKKGYPTESKEAIAAVKPKDWNTLKIEVKGSTYKTWLNGVKGITYTSETAIEKGPLGLQLHPGNTMEISFRNIEITESE